ncbi:hypothetical protein EJV46_10370 [Roseococcus sp. SYP-B2431]|uniref:hypothetical protein n=1 Tax=Roseococcus sp. SYP-B2431 TaxID=2496640 RepID=UPI00103FE973|nr:hypothetical protein [Roseococcus sp. SYP-B2431]TCH98948.1 hypothetical protein EJV46_10370 [Roseococcus sp. SYP-B2431]
MSDSIRNDLGDLNNGWGICGFTSTFYAMSSLQHGTRGALINASRPFNVLAEIKTFLRILQAGGKQKALSDITAFTRSFGKPYDKFTIENYISRIDNAARENLSDDEIKKNQLFGVAVPPDQVVAYVENIWGLKCSISKGENQENGIIGVKSKGISNLWKPYNGLVHYMYRHNQKIYSWGEVYNSIKDARKSFELVLTIRIDGAGKTNPNFR